MNKVSFFALVRMDVGDGHRNPGDLVPEAADWAMLNSYISEGRIAPVLTATLPGDLQAVQQDFEDNRERTRSKVDAYTKAQKVADKVAAEGGTPEAAEAARRLSLSESAEKFAADFKEPAPWSEAEEAKRRLKAAEAAEKQGEKEAHARGDKTTAELIEEDEANPRIVNDAEGNDTKAAEEADDGEVQPADEDDEADDDDDGEGKGPDDGDVPPYSEWKKSELQEELLTRDIDYPASANKPELVDLLEKNDAEEEAKAAAADANPQG